MLIHCYNVCHRYKESPLQCSLTQSISEDWTVCLQVLVTYGSRVVSAGPTSDPYGQKYKGIWICLELLKRGLAGNYVNFGVFELYGDPALKVAPLFLSETEPQRLRMDTHACSSNGNCIHCLGMGTGMGTGTCTCAHAQALEAHVIG